MFKYKRSKSIRVGGMTTSSTEFESFILTPKELRTSKARQVYIIVDPEAVKRITEYVRASFLILGPGEGSEGYELRKMIKKVIESKKQVATFPEDVPVNKLYEYLSSHGIDSSYLSRVVVNLTTREYVLMLGYDITIILLMSDGSISEYSTYFIKRNVAHKIWVYQSESVSHAPSYVNMGPLDLFSKVYRQVDNFTSSQNLKKNVRGRIDDLLAYLFISSV